eukprot:1317895-Amorphochlora_amoeboformis.AAC.1
MKSQRFIRGKEGVDNENNTLRERTRARMERKGIHIERGPCEEDIPVSLLRIFFFSLSRIPSLSSERAHASLPVCVTAGILISRVAVTSSDVL